MWSRTRWAIVLAMLGSAAAAQASPMTYLQCDLDTYTRFVGVNDPQPARVKIVSGFGFRAAPPSAQDVFSPNVPLEGVAVSDGTVQFTSKIHFTPALS